MRDAGAFVYEAGVSPANAVRMVQVRNGQVSVQPRPVAGAGEVVAGLSIVEM
ncbi:hypothetical protein DAETH_43850 (plasmid) [Deinococcus aetherius]|uniref:PASTA domain-containing protein n=1 Tax=Deinococcus aetherius TaxID=200252 RepID=A0ABM8AKQ8_9DEIO|nr:hypothetical protein [Deinococcus aetherius]BDP44416.1 hypothetical protein DAETH_43850 [Deinococcus aetherius]